MSDRQLDDNDKNEDRRDDGRETDPLLPERAPSVVAVQQPRGLVLPEVAAFLYFLALVTQYPVVQYWLYDHFAREYDLVTGNETNACSNDSESSNSSNADLEKKVQLETNQYIMYTSLISNFVAIFPTLFLGPLTDKYGRKFVFYVSMCGLSGNLLLNIFIMRFDLSPALVCVSSFILGLSGSYGLFLVACFGIVADITSPGKQRAFRVTTVEAVIAVASSIATATAGVLVSQAGYVWPMVVSVGLLALGIIFVFFFVPETLASSHYRSFSCSTLLKSFSFYIKDTPDKRRFRLIAYLVSFLMMLWASIGEANFSTLFLFHVPFCWSKEQISLFNGALALVKWIVAVLFLWVGRRCISEPVFALVGLVSAASSYLLRGLADSNLLIFIGAGTSLMMALVEPMCRTMLSKAVARNEQGSLFSGIGVLQMVVSTVSGVVMSNIYEAGLNVYLGLPYLVLAGMVALCILLLM
ncbi:hypothetical protein ACOMHN_040055 [Nucella lapillus]